MLRRYGEAVTMSTGRGVRDSGDLAIRTLRFTRQRRVYAICDAFARAATYDTVRGEHARRARCGTRWNGTTTRHRRTDGHGATAYHDDAGEPPSKITSDNHMRAV